MPLSVEQFVKLLEDCRILGTETINGFLPPNAAPKDGQELARTLVRNRKLTKFQAEVIYQGKGRSLVLGNYVLFEKVGVDQGGAVFKAQHRWMKRLCVIKVLPPSLMKDQDAVARFQRGVEAAAKLRHPNFVTADDADFCSGVQFLVMEYIDGSDLSALVKQDGPFSIEAAINIVMQAGRGLAVAHAQGIVHGDIRPAKLLLDKTGTVKILGTGMARMHAAGDAATQPESRVTNTISGTVDFLAPEQALTLNAADPRSDIYSLGCTLFYLLTGRPPYEGETKVARLLAHQNEPIPSIRALRSEVSQALDVVFGRMVVKSVDDRYQTLTAAVADLERCGANGKRATQ